MIIILFLIVILECASYSPAKESTNILDRCIIACHTTDFECFKRQYKAMRDQVLFGNEMLGLEIHEAHRYEYGRSGTCVKLSGMEDSELVAISMDSSSKEYSIVLELPLRIQQVKKGMKPCARPERAFEGVGPHKELVAEDRILFDRLSNKKHRPEIGLYNFAIFRTHEEIYRQCISFKPVTVQVSYPYTLLKKKEDTYIILEEENLDVVLDIPDLSHFHKNSRLEVKLYEWSEWSYHVVQHTDIAQRLIMPITGRLRTVMERMPLQRFLLLYPEEEYSTIQFMYAKTITQ